MIHEIKREDVKAKMDNNADFLLLEVLPEAGIKRGHLPGAINVPLDDDFKEKVQRKAPDKSRDIIVYCQGTECPMAMQAAHHMEELGYEKIEYYPGGKEAWEDAGYSLSS